MILYISYPVNILALLQIITNAEECCISYKPQWWHAPTRYIALLW